MKSKTKKENIEKDHWFRAKCYGWGWYPCSWQGWIVLLVWFLLFVPLVVMVEENLILNFSFIFVITALLIWICWRTGEKPRWRWGR